MTDGDLYDEVSRKRADPTQKLHDASELWEAATKERLRLMDQRFRYKAVVEAVRDLRRTYEATGGVPTVGAKGTVGPLFAALNRLDEQEES